MMTTKKLKKKDLYEILSINLWIDPTNPENIAIGNPKSGLSLDHARSTAVDILSRGRFISPCPICQKRTLFTHLDGRVRCVGWFGTSGQCTFICKDHTELKRETSIFPENAAKW